MLRARALQGRVRCHKWWCRRPKSPEVATLLCPAVPQPYSLLVFAAGAACGGGRRELAVQTRRHQSRLVSSRVRDGAAEGQRRVPEQSAVASGVVGAQPRRSRGNWPAPRPLLEPRLPRLCMGQSFWEKALNGRQRERHHGTAGRSRRAAGEQSRTSGVGLTPWLRCSQGLTGRLSAVVVVRRR